MKFLIAALLACSTAVQAQSFPSRPLRLVLPKGPDKTELQWTYIGFEDDDAAMTERMSELAARQTKLAVDPELVTNASARSQERLVDSTEHGETGYAL